MLLRAVCAQHVSVVVLAHHAQRQVRRAGCAANLPELAVRYLLADSFLVVFLACFCSGLVSPLSLVSPSTAGCLAFQVATRLAHMQDERS